MFAGPIDDIDEIPHKAGLDSVIEITCDTCREQGQSNLCNFAFLSGEKKYQNHHYQRRYRDPD